MLMETTRESIGQKMKDKSNRRVREGYREYQEFPNNMEKRKLNPRVMKLMERTKI